jgi:hypothetical protein
MSATAGKVALVSSTSALTGSCPASDPNLLDFVGFGSASNCSLGSPTATLSNTTAAIRSNACVNTNNNSVDFKLLAPAPRNMATTLAACPPSTTSAPPTVAGLATPASAFVGDPILLTATVISGTLPASTGIQVSGNLSTIGGSATQSFYDDGTHGDVTAGDNIFSFVVTTSTTGSFSMPVTATDSRLRSCFRFDCPDSDDAAAVCDDRDDSGEQAFDLCDADGDDERHRDWREVERVLT